VSLSEEWREKAWNVSADDCKIPYPFPRNLFCIDHGTGSISAKPQLLEYGKSEKFTLTIFTSEELSSTLVVHFLINQDETLYKDYIKNCDTRPRVEFIPPGNDRNAEVFDSSFTFKQQRMYLTGIEYVDFEDSFIIRLVSAGAEVILSNSSESKLYGKYDIQETFGRLQKPIIVEKNQNFSINLENSKGEIIRSNRRQHRLYLLPLKDYCRNEKCIEIGIQILNAGTTKTKNIFDSITKYGFCDCE
jgi:hypothetical protein